MGTGAVGRIMLALLVVMWAGWVVFWLWEIVDLYR